MAWLILGGMSDSELLAPTLSLLVTNVDGPWMIGKGIRYADRFDGVLCFRVRLWHIVVLSWPIWRLEIVL